MGRPPKSGDKAMTSRLEIRVGPDEKRAYADAAREAGVAISDWARAVLNAAAQSAPRPLARRAPRAKKAEEQ